MKKTILVALLALANLPVLAAEYFVVVPIQGKTAPASPSTPSGDPAPSPQPEIAVGLNAYTLPDGVVGATYAGFDFKSVLQVTGDAAYDPAQATFTAANLPAGLTLSTAGLLAGVPSVKNTTGAIFDVTATYKTKSSQHAYSVVIYDRGASCAEILQNQPAAGDGVYTLLPDGTTEVQTYCDMTNGGWTLVARRDNSKTTGVATTSFTSADPATPSFLPNSVWVALNSSATQLRVVKGGSPLSQASIMSLSKVRNANCGALASSLSQAKLFHNEASGCGITGLDYTLLGVTSTRPAYISNMGSVKWDVAIDSNVDYSNLTVWVK